MVIHLRVFVYSSRIKRGNVSLAALKACPEEIITAKREVIVSAGLTSPLCVMPSSLPRTAPVGGFTVACLCVCLSRLHVRCGVSVCVLACVIDWLQAHTARRGC